MFETLTIQQTFETIQTSDATNHFRFKPRSDILFENGNIFLCIYVDISTKFVPETKMWVLHKKMEH